MAEDTRSFAQRIAESRELLQAVGEALAAKLEEKVLMALPDNATPETVATAYQDFLTAEPELGKVVLGLKNGTLDARDTGEFLYAKQAVAEEAQNWEQRFLEDVKAALRGKPGMQEIVDTGRFHAVEERGIREDIQTVLEEDPKVMHDMTRHRQAKQRDALYTDVLDAIGEPEVVQAIALTKHTGRER